MPPLSRYNMPEKKRKRHKVRLWPHEQALLKEGRLANITHTNASSTWLHADSTILPIDNDDRVLCYRHMGDAELQFFLETNTLPSTQPYQTITLGAEGRVYCEKYFRSNKYVDTAPTTIVEFNCNAEMIDSFFKKQSKIEDGTISHGLGDKAGKTLQEFNASLLKGDTTWRIVLVKRPTMART